jgi:site-specific DNA-methyltransferase (adenine-specific)
MLAPALFASTTDEWPTPAAFFARLDRKYRFTLDAAASPANAKCPLYFTREQDGLAQDWGSHRVFCNPPYGRKIVGAFGLAMPMQARRFRPCWRSTGRDRS